jgi:hypothetical protein
MSGLIFPPSPLSFLAGSLPGLLHPPVLSPGHALCSLLDAIRNETSKVQRRPLFPPRLGWGHIGVAGIEERVGHSTPLGPGDPPSTPTADQASGTEPGCSPATRPG